MPRGTIGGLTMDWSKRDIEDARKAGQFFKPATERKETTIPTTKSMGISKKKTEPLIPKSSTDIMEKARKEHEAIMSSQKRPAVTSTSTPTPVVTPQAIDYGRISDMITKAIGATKPEPYQSPLQPEIMRTLEQIRQYPQFQYDPTQDVGLQQAQAQAREQVRQEMARRGRVFDPYAQAKEVEVAQQLIPAYQQMARQGYQQDISNLYRQLGALTGLEQTGYGREQDILTRQRQQEQDVLAELQRQFGREQTVLGRERQAEQDILAEQQRQFGRDVTEAGITGEFRGTPTAQQQERQRQREIEDFGVELSDTARGLRGLFQQYVATQPERVRVLEQLGNTLAGGFAEAINNPARFNLSQEDVNILQSLRFNKIIKSPELLAQYGAEYGMDTPAIQQASERVKAEKVLRELKIEEQRVANTQKAIELQKLAAEIERYMAETEYKSAQTEKTRQDALMTKAERLALPQKLQNDLRESLALAEQRRASAGLSREKITTEIEERGKEKPMTTAERNQSMADDIAGIKSLSVADAIKELQDGERDYRATYGDSGYKQLWNAVLANAIRAGQAQSYDDYYSGY